MLKARVRELEQRPLQHTYNPLSKQVEVVRKGQNVLHGPDTPTRFDNFSLAAVTDELCTFASEGAATTHQLHACGTDYK